MKTFTVDYARESVYLIRIGNLFKIGLSKNVMSRFDALMKEFRDQPLHMLNAMITKNRFAAENFLHKLYEEFWVEGELFALPEDVVWELMQIKNLDDFIKTKIV